MGRRGGRTGEGLWGSSAHGAAPLAMPRRGRKADRPGHGHGPAAATSRGSVATALAGLGLMGGLAAASSLPCLALLLYLSRAVEVAPEEAQRMPWEDGHRRLLAAAAAGLAALGLGLGLACGALAAALSLLAAALHGPGCEGARYGVKSMGVTHWGQKRGSSSLVLSSIRFSTPLGHGRCSSF